MMRSNHTALALCALLAGCSLALDPSRYQGGGGDSGTGVDSGPRDGGDVRDDGGGSDGGGEPSCAGGLACEPAAPTGWMGPILLVTNTGDANPPACPSTAPSTAFTALSGLNASAASCGCACTPPSAAQMGCGTGTLQTVGDAACAALGSNHSALADGECRSISSLPSTGRWTLTRPSFMTSATGCTPAPSIDVPAVTWGASHRACGFGAPASCGDSSVCVPPRGAGERLCVYVDGDAACPAGFPELISTAEDATDDRGCSDCACGSLAGMCSGTVDIISSCAGGGSTILYARVGVGSCTAAVSAATPHASADFTPSASCPPTEPTATGSATPTGVRTVCCVPE